MKKGIILRVMVLSIALFVSLASSQTQANSWETMKYGLFVHYVYGGENGNLTPITRTGGYPKNIDELVDKFNVQKWAEDVQSMGFEYVIFTAWHCNMNILYPSEKMNSWRGAGHATKKRDLLQEIITALEARKIKISFYTCTNVGQDLHPAGDGYYPEGSKVTDDQKKTGFYPAANKNATAKDKEIWNNFINDIYDEMFSRYKKNVFLLWGDCGWGPTDFKRVFTTIKKYNPDIALLRNGGAGDGFQYGAKELCAPEYNGTYNMKDLNPNVRTNDVTTWPAYYPSIAFRQGAGWWASPWGKAQHSGEFIYRYTVLNAGVSTEGGVSWSIGCYGDGTWEPDIISSMTRAYQLIKPIEESIKNTLRSTSYVTEKGATIKNIKNGIVATKSPDNKYEYIHVLRPPSDKSLQLSKPADGKKFNTAILLHNKKNVTIKENSSGYLLTLPNDENWSSLNTTIRLSNGSTQTSNAEIQKSSTSFNLYQINNCLQVNLPDRAVGMLSIYNINGKIVDKYKTDGHGNSFQTKKLEAGYYVIKFNGTCNFSSGYTVINYK